MKAYFANKTPSNEQGASIASNLSGEENDKMFFMLKEGYVRIAPVRHVSLRSPPQWHTSSRTHRQWGERN